MVLRFRWYSRSEQKGKYKDKFIGMSKDYTIAMYFPTGVRDNVSVDYEAKEVGLSDIALDSLLNAEFGTLLDAAGGAFGETFQKAKQAAVAFSAFESGVVVDNPKLILSKVSDLETIVTHSHYIHIMNRCRRNY